MENAQAQITSTEIIALDGDMSLKEEERVIGQLRRELETPYEERDNAEMGCEVKQEETNNVPPADNRRRGRLPYREGRTRERASQTAVDSEKRKRGDKGNEKEQEGGNIKHHKKNSSLTRKLSEDKDGNIVDLAKAMSGESDSDEQNGSESVRKLMCKILRQITEAKEEVGVGRSETRKKLNAIGEKLDQIEKKFQKKERDLIEELRKIDRRLCIIELKVKETQKGQKQVIKEAGTKLQERPREAKDREETEKRNVINCLSVLRDLKWAMEAREKEERRNNIVIRGLKTGITQQEQTVRKFLAKEFEVENKIKRIRLGYNNRKPILVELEDWSTKQKIMLKKKKLKGKNIYVDHDMTKEERRVQNRIKQRAKKEKMKGRKVQVTYRRIKIGEEWYKWNEAKDELEKEEFFNGKNIENKEA